MIEKKELSSSLFVRPSNKMEGQFILKLQKETLLRSNVKVRGKNSINALLNIPPSNRMEGVFEIFPPPRYKKIYTPIKDAFVRSSVPTLNYGSTSELIVGYNASLNERYRTFMQFDLSDMPKDMVIISAKLKLNCIDVDSSFNNLEISTTNKTFEEYGVTWNSQPAKSKLLNMVNINANEGYVDIDITKVVEGWYADNTSNNGLVFKAFNETINQVKRFFSRDNRLTPILEIEYLDPYVPVYDKSSMHSSITIKRKDNKALEASIIINSYSKRNDIKASLKIHNPNTVEANLTIVKRQINGSLNIKERTALPASLYVLYAKTYDLPAKIDICRKYIFCSIRIVKYANMLSSMAVKRKTNITINASIKVQGNLIKGKLYIRDRADFPAWVYVKGKEKSTLSANFVISNRFIKGSLRVIKHNSVAGSLYIVRKVENKLKSSIAVNKHDSSDLVANGKTRAMTQMPSNMQLISKYFKCSMVVQVPKESYLNASIVKVRAAQGVFGKIANVRATTTVYGRMTIKTKWFSDMYVTAHINGERRKKKAYVFII